MNMTTEALGSQARQKGRTELQWTSTNKAESDINRALVAAWHQLVSAFGIVRSRADDAHVQNYQRAIALCDSALEGAQ